MPKQTTLRTETLTPNENISFPIGTILAVEEFYEKLEFDSIFGKHKKRGRNINSLNKALVSYKLTENLSVSKGSNWINRDEILKRFKLKRFDERTLFRLLEIIGENWEEIIADIQDAIFERYDFEHTNINLDWTSIVLYGNKAHLGKHGYSRDHRPDKKQITMGISELSSPINVPIGLTVRAGNVNDVKHFKDTYGQVRDKLREGSRIVHDKGAICKENEELILRDKMKYLTSKKLNTSDDKRINEFDKTKAELVDAEDGVYGIKIRYPSRIDYFYFSEKLQREQLESSVRTAYRKFEEAKEIQHSIETRRGLPKRFRINNVLIDISYSYQTKLATLSEREAWSLIKNASITGREGFFCLVSNEDLTLQEALATYRKKDSIEKIFNSLKNEIEIKPLRVWTDESIYGALVIGFMAQLFISLMRYEREELKHVSTKFIKTSLMNLTVTVEIRNRHPKRSIYANFDRINQVVLADYLAKT